MISILTAYKSPGLNTSAPDYAENKKCLQLKFVAVVCTSITFFSIIFNGVLLSSFYKSQSLRSSVNKFVICLTALNLIATVVEQPFVIVSNFSCRYLSFILTIFVCYKFLTLENHSWIFGRPLCVLTAFVMYFIGCSSCYLMMCISYERLYVIYYPTALNQLKASIYTRMITMCLALGLFWSVLF
jgi:hypothetical protein